MPQISWDNPAGIVYGTALGPAQLDASASFAGHTLSGTFTYTPAAGTVLPAGGGQTLAVRFTPADATDFESVTGTVSINVAPALVTVVGAHWQTRKLSKKKTTKVLVISFSGALDANAARVLGDYQLATLVKAKKGAVHTGKAVKLTSATYDPSGHTVTITPKGTVPASPLQLTIIAAKTLDAEGRQIDGDHDGQPGGNFKTTLSKVTARAVKVH
jgi:hypothetical protein